VASRVQLAVGKVAEEEEQMAVQTHRDHIANPSHRSLSLLTTKLTGVYIKLRTS
jgi:hypothetical protein